MPPLSTLSTPSPPASDIPANARSASIATIASVASRSSRNGSRAAPNRTTQADADPSERASRESQTLTHAKRTLALRREPPKTSDIERYLRRWFVAPPSVLITLASDEELLARNATYPTLSPTSRRFGDIAYAAYSLAEGHCGHDGTYLRTSVVAITLGSGTVTFPAIQAWTHDGDALARAEALTHLHLITEHLRLTTPVQHLHRHSLYEIEAHIPPSHPPVLQSTHRTARLGMWLASAALLARGSASLESVLHDIRIGTAKFDPTFRQSQELSRLARSRNRRKVSSTADIEATDVTCDVSDNAIESPPLSRTLHDARPALLSQRSQ